MKVLLINNGGHPGIHAVGLGYKRALESLGIEFEYLELLTTPRMHVQKMNYLVRGHLSVRQYTHVIFIQPTYVDVDTFNYLRSIMERTTLISIQTEDPYGLHGIYQLDAAFHMKFTNEKMVADAMAGRGYKYLPVAFDSMQPFCRKTDKIYDFTMICNFYEERLKYLGVLTSIGSNNFINGNIGYAVEKHLPIDTTMFSGNPGMLSRHMEYKTYSQSYFVLNPHRDPSIVGRSNFLGTSQECKMIMPLAVSPNPRFFDAIGTGAVPLCDAGRTECQAILRDLGYDLPCLPDPERHLFNDLLDMKYECEKKINSRERRALFLKKHTYVQRALEVVKYIGETL